MRPWPLYAIPATAGDRERALDRILDRVGLAPGSVARRTRWALRGLLRRWWDAGLCPAQVLHALGHHPDQPTRTRPPLTGGARDLAAVTGARLRPWIGRVDELPARLTGHPATHLTSTVPDAIPDAVQSPSAAEPAPPLPQTQPTSASAALRAQLRAQFAAAEAARLARRDPAGPGTHPTSRRPLRGRRR